MPTRINAEPLEVAAACMFVVLVIPLVIALVMVALTPKDQGLRPCSQYANTELKDVPARCVKELTQ